MASTFGFNRDDAPVIRKRVTEVKKIGATEVLTAIIVSMQHHGFWFHWNGERTVPCNVSHELCEGHLKQWPLKWNGYIHVFEERTGNDWFLELTDFALGRLKKIQGERPTLRGMIVTCCRERSNKHAPLTFTLHGECQPERMANLKERDVEPTLKRIFKMKS